MKYYDYSVKELLTGFYGENAIFSMRNSYGTVHESEDITNLLPIEWRYADNETREYFAGSAFLLDTVLYDDYIAYIGKFNEEKIVYLLFMLSEEGPSFDIDTEYAKSLLREWGQKGYKAAILTECVDVEYYGNDHSHGFRITAHQTTDHINALYELRHINGKDILVPTVHSCWEHYFRKVKAVANSLETSEYECLFEPNVVITTGEEKAKKTLSQGIDSVKQYFSLNSPVEIAYVEVGNTGIFSRRLIAGENDLIIYVDRLNLISEIYLCALRAEDGIIYETEESSADLIGQVPGIAGIRILDPVQMHGFAVQINYGKDNIRNYYLSCFEGKDIPEKITVEDYEFSRDDLYSACADDEGNLHFSNGYVIPKHILYYRSYRQMQPAYTGVTAYEGNGIKIESIYKLPLTESKDALSLEQYWGYPDECFGPNKAWMDHNGRRISDIALKTIQRGCYNIGATLVSVEPTGKYGFINDDGSWLVPPIYDEADCFCTGCAKALRTVDGVKKTFLITEDGKEKEFNYSIDVEGFANDRCAFNAEEWTGTWPDPGHYWEIDDVVPGKWGFIDSDGEIVIEPQYVYAVGFDLEDEGHSVVAKYVGEELRWGAIDMNGNETIPCKYHSLYSLWDGAVAFQTEENDLYGVMDYNGHVIVKPQYYYIHEIDLKHGLITAGEDSDHMGVYSIESGEMLIPPQYDCIDYYKRMISCSNSYSNPFARAERYDYSGNKLDFSEYDSVYEEGDYLSVRKNGQSGLIDWEKNVLIPPVEKEGLWFDQECIKKGCVVSRIEKKEGLIKLSGEVIIPEIYSSLAVYDELVIASDRTDEGWNIAASLFTINGEKIMSGALKNMHIDLKEMILSAETPTGEEYFKIEMSLDGRPNSLHFTL